MRKPSIRFLALCGAAAVAAGAGLLGPLGAAAPARPIGATAHAHSHRARHPAGRRHRSSARARSAGTAVAKMIWGPLTMPNGASAFATYRQLGVKVFEIDLEWAQAAPTRPSDPTNPADPAYKWPGSLNAVVAEAAKYGIQVCLLVQKTPGWANGRRSAAWAPTNPADYADFLIAATKEYPQIHRWMIWGEPNRSGNFEPMPAHSPVGPRAYAVLLNAAYHALKSVSSSNIVIGGDTWSFGDVEPADFVMWMRLPNGQPPPLDDYGHNPFSRRFPKRGKKPYFPGGRDIDDLATLEHQLQGIYHRQVALWLSEFTISSGHANRAFSFAVSVRQQARWISAAFRLVNSYGFVAALGWFELLDETKAQGGLTNGLMTAEGTPKPAFYAYENAR
jgi:hypothetical protein